MHSVLSLVDTHDNHRTTVRILTSRFDTSFCCSKDIVEEVVDVTVVGFKNIFCFHQIHIFWKQSKCLDKLYAYIVIVTPLHIAIVWNIASEMEVCICKIGIWKQHDHLKQDQSMSCLSHYLLKLTKDYSKMLQSCSRVFLGVKNLLDWLLDIHNSVSLLWKVEHLGMVMILSHPSWDNTLKALRSGIFW